MAAMCPLARHFIRCLVLVQDRKSFRHDWKKCWLGRKAWKQAKHWMCHFLTKNMSAPYLLSQKMDPVETLFVVLGHIKELIPL